MAVPKKQKLPINVLPEHLNKYKDAVIILGPDILGEIKQFEINEETYDFYNRKLMIKNPQEFWKYFSDNIMHPTAATNDITKQVVKLLSMCLHSSVIDTNIVHTIPTHYKIISPNGKNDVLECVKCHKEYDANKMFNQLQEQDKVLKCSCGGNIKPTVLYHGEKYSAPIYQSVKDAIFTEENGRPELKTHTLMFIGVDFTDSLISELIDSYDALKDNQHYTVIISDKLNRDDVIYYEPEFGVADNLDSALIRLMNLLKEKE
jgi:hypothetical protein